MSWVYIGGKYWDNTPINIPMAGVCGPYSCPRHISWGGVGYYPTPQYTPSDFAELASKFEAGTRIPTVADCEGLIDACGGWASAGGALKALSFGGSDTFGFGMLPTADLFGYPPSFYPQSADGESYGASPLPDGTVYNYTRFWLSDTIFVAARGSDSLGSNSNPYGMVSIYTVRDSLPILPAPSIYPPSGTFQGVQIVTIQGSGVIRYTLDGSEPTTSSPIYTVPFRISSPTTVKAKAFGLPLESTTATAILDIQGASLQRIPNYRDHVLPYLLEQYKGDNP